MWGAIGGAVGGGTTEVLKSAGSKITSELGKKLIQDGADMAVDLTQTASENGKITGKDLLFSAASSLGGDLVGGLNTKSATSNLVDGVSDNRAVKDAVKDSATDKNIVNVEVKAKEGWTEEQIAQAEKKLKALSEANTVKTKVDRKGTSASRRYKSAYGKDSVPTGYDVDHTIDLQLGGADEVSNMNPLDMSVNRSLGAQIQNAIKDYEYGTPFGEFTLKK